MLVCVFFASIARETAGTACTRLSLRPCVPEICQNVTTGGSHQPPVAGTEPVAPKGDRACQQSKGQLRCLPQPEQLQGLRARTRQGREWMMTQHDLVVFGIDVAKDKVDACIRTVTERRTSPTTPPGRRSLIAWLRKHQVGKAVMEGSGGC